MLHRARLVLLLAVLHALAGATACSAPHASSTDTMAEDLAAVDGSGEPSDLLISELPGLDTGSDVPVGSDGMGPDGDLGADTAPEVVDPCDQPERCNGLDDDCDGLVDEGLAGLPSRARRVILFIADGTGFAHVEAARMFANGDTAPLSFEEFPHRGQVSTFNAIEGTTDSAAAATAMATGRTVTNGVIARALPGDGAKLPSVLDAHAQLGRYTGLVTTYTAATDATPAAFGAHAVTRSDKVAIAASYLTESRPQVLMGLADAALTPQAAAEAGYTVATTPAEFSATTPQPGETPFLAGLFVDKASTPPLADMVTKALDVLDRSPHGFFLLVEHEGTDEASHSNDTEVMLDSLLEIEQAVATARAWAEGKDDVLIVFTADHETGGLLVTETEPIAGFIPEMSWNTGGHTTTPVPIFAWGAGAEQLKPSILNTEVYDLIAPMERVRLTQGVKGYSGAHDTTLREGFPSGLLGDSPAVVVDADSPSGSGLAVQSLLRFEGLRAGLGLGTGDAWPFIGQARLTVTAHDSGNALALHAMHVPWDEADTWDTTSAGISVDGSEASGASEGRSSSVGIGPVAVPVTHSLRRWLRPNGTPNHGWVMNPTGSQGVTMSSSEASYDRPSLVVDFTCGVRTAEFEHGAVSTPVQARVLQLAAASSKTPAEIIDGVVHVVPNEAAFLLGFDEVFGGGEQQVPMTATIVSASVTWSTTGASGPVALYPMLLPWTAETTWASFGEDGVQNDGVEAGLVAAGSSPATEGPGRRTLDVTASVRAWQQNPNEHYGWVALASDSQATIDVTSQATEDATGSPTLRIVYAP